MQATKFHLGWFMNGYRVHGWRDQWIGTHKSEGMLPDFYVDMARSLERACFDYFILEDSSFVPDACGGKARLLPRKRLCGTEVRFPLYWRRSSPRTPPGWAS